MYYSAVKHILQICSVFEKHKWALLAKINQLPEEVLEGLLKNNIKFVHICLARNIKPVSCLPAMIKTSGIIYARKTAGAERLFLRTIGFENMAFLKYLKTNSKDQNYKTGLLNTTAWRDERNYK